MTTTATTHTVSLPDDMPRPIRLLPKDSVGRPVPKFVEWIDGEPDFRIMDVGHLKACVLEALCWTCGHPLKKHRFNRTPLGTFVVGPMCVVNRVSAEPPSHADCAEWSARACPFLSNPKKLRRDKNMPANAVEAPGVAIMRNPGVTALVASEGWRPMAAPGGVLFRFGIQNVSWWAHGRNATNLEVYQSIESGLPVLREAAETEMGAVQALARQTALALRWVSGGRPEGKWPNLDALLAEQP